MNSRTSNKSTFVRLAAWALCAGPIVVSAADRSQVRPFREDLNAAGIDRPLERERGDVGRPGIGGRSRIPITDEEWKATEEFLSVHAPNRLAFVRKIGEGPHKENLKHVLYGLVRNINALRTESPSIYKLRIEEFELDDQIFAICRELRTAQGTERQKLQGQLRDKITLLFDKGLDERKDRIDRLQKMLEDQKTALDKDRTDRTQIIEKRYLVISKNGVDGARLNVTKEENAPPKSVEPPASSPADE